MRLKISLPQHPRPNYSVQTSLGEYRLVYAEQPQPVGREVAYAIRAVSGIRIDMTAYYPMAELERLMATGIELFSPGRRPETNAIAEALIRAGVATESTDAVPSRR